MVLQTHPPKRLWLFWLVPVLAVAAFGIDQWVKWYFFHHAEVHVKLIGDWLSLSGYLNTRMALSLPLITWVYYPLVGIVVAVLLFVLYRAVRNGHWVDAGIIVFIFVGAVSNMLDRFVYSGVVDYIAVSGWSVFNLADAYIVVAIVVWLLRLWMEDRADRKPVARIKRHP